MNVTSLLLQEPQFPYRCHYIGQDMSFGVDVVALSKWMNREHFKMIGFWDPRPGPAKTR